MTSGWAAGLHRGGDPRSRRQHYSTSCWGRYVPHDLRQPPRLGPAGFRTVFTGLGYSFNDEFSDDKAQCLVISDTIFAMLLKRDFFATFTDRPVANAQETSQVLLCLSPDSREHVDQLVDKAVSGGGKEVRSATDQRGMCGRSFADLDGHIWEILWMQPPTG